jgi:hypothetical protein
MNSASFTRRAARSPVLHRTWYVLQQVHGVNSYKALGVETLLISADGALSTKWSPSVYMRLKHASMCWFISRLSMLFLNTIWHTGHAGCSSSAAAAAGGAPRQERPLPRGPASSWTKVACQYTVCCSTSCWTIWGGGHRVVVGCQYTVCCSTSCWTIWGGGHRVVVGCHVVVPPAGLYGVVGTGVLWHVSTLCAVVPPAGLYGVVGTGCCGMSVHCVL